MAKKGGGNGRNDERKCGKAWKKRPQENNKTGKSCCGYSLKRTDRLGHHDNHRKVVKVAVEPVLN